MGQVWRYSLLLLHTLKYLERNRTQLAAMNEADYVLYYLFNYLTPIFIDEQDTKSSPFQIITILMFLGRQRSLFDWKT